MSKRKMAIVNGSRLGFTLVELLIVVAIIGILVTAGRASYSKMLQKSRQGEAKVLLGALRTAESAFFAEHGTYGDQISKVGFEVEGLPSYYTVGFANVGASTCNHKNYTMPGLGTPNRASLLIKFSGYFIGPAFTRIRPANPPPTCASGTVFDANGDPTGNSYIGSASAIISPNVDPATALTIGSGKYDVWSLGSDTDLINTFDGIK